MSKLELDGGEQLGLLLSFTGATGIVIGILTAETHGLVYGMSWVGSGLMSLGFGMLVLTKHGGSMSMFGAGVGTLFVAAALRVSGVA